MKIFITVAAVYVDIISEIRPAHRYVYSYIQQFAVVLIPPVDTNRINFPITAVIKPFMYFVGSRAPLARRIRAFSLPRNVPGYK